MPLPLSSAHNFPVFRKGKRSILQLDFSYKKVNVIERGNIKKSFDFDELSHYDSEENLTVVVKFHNSKEVEFDADTTEEKYAICRLLSFILGDELLDEQTGVERRENGIHAHLKATKQVLKEGVIEKRGNTKIPTWSKRRLQVCPGEFSYYKPGDEIALDLIQLRENTSSVTSYGNNGFLVTVKERTYQFRVTGVPSVEVERKKWVQAFDQAIQKKRTTILLLGNGDVQLRPKHGKQPPTIVEGQEAVYANAENDLTEEFQVISELDEIIDRESKQRDENWRLSVVGKTSPLESLPTKQRPKPPAFNVKAPSPTQQEPTQNDPEEVIYAEIPEPDYSPPPSPTLKKGSLSSASSGDSDPRASGAYKSVIKSTPTEPKIQAKDEQSKPIGRAALIQSGNYAQVIRNKDTKTEENKPNLGISSGSKDTTTAEQKDNENKIQSSSVDDGKPIGVQAQVKVFDSKGSESQTNEVVYANENKSSRNKGPAPPPPSVAAPAPPAPPVPAPPPIPSRVERAHHGGSRSKLKHIHWSKIPKQFITNSLWDHARNMTDKINLTLLEEQFSVLERDPLPPQTPKGGKHQLLIDNKRAQNLGIFISGLKAEGSRKLVDVLNSITEDESFPAEKLVTIRRYKPTTDEIDMYLEYRHKRQELHPVDQFMLELCEIPFLAIRLDLALTLWDFPRQFESISQLVDQCHVACDELWNNSKLANVFEYLLAIGNVMNKNMYDGGDTKGFQIGSLDKVLDVRGREPGYTLVHFLVEQIKQTDPRLLNWPESVATVKKCEGCSVRGVVAESEVLKGDLQKLKKNLKTVKNKMANPARPDLRFHQEAQRLILDYEMHMGKLCDKCVELQEKHKRLLVHFGEPAYTRTDDFFTLISRLADKFKSARQDVESKSSKH